MGAYAIGPMAKKSLIFTGALTGLQLNILQNILDVQENILYSNSLALPSDQKHLLLLTADFVLDIL